MRKEDVPTLARQTETLLIEVAQAGVEPVTYAWLAQRLTESGASSVPTRSAGQVLRAMSERHGSYSWTRLLTAFVVDEATGEPGEAYADAALGEAAEVRATAHQRLTSGIYEPRHH